MDRVTQSMDEDEDTPSYPPPAGPPAEHNLLPLPPTSNNSGNSSELRGPVPMPPQPALKDDELTLLAGWILAGAPDK